MKTALTIGLIFLPMSGFAEIYKSTDKHGNVTFSQTPPRNDALEYQLNTGQARHGDRDNSDAAGAGRNPAPSNFDKQKRYLDYLTRERLERSEKRAQKKLQKAQLRNKCYQARARLEDLSQGRVVYYDLDKDGNKVIVEDKDMQGRKNQLHNFLSRHCSGIK